ncbi:GNAT family N-acetyltransferase [Paenibacillus allorhizosphaerae]|uniref:N-acetyltransferase domain-containing protein n=1 Tax=Paenibacillus allorhizosphaerae TaxID=2849866 RepID=A0ABN7TKU6_9BACL|nr:GNAT family N-acetyltransferase [Paenibacillus allorhizosphaerae]CAG7644549.1 hypothetical protein PAECIP111802_03308 [Paenibacillus allorhizosphaerae]
MNVRKGQLSDAGQLCGLSEQLGYAAEEQQMHERLSRILKDADHAVYVMDDEEHGVVGWAHVHGRHLLESDPFAEIGGLVVDDRHQRMGIGKKLMRACEGWAREAGYGIVRVRSGAQRKEAHEFYKGIGYEHVKAQQVFNLNLNRE